METLSFSVEKWQNIISILNSIKLPSKIKFKKANGRVKTLLFQKAEMLGHKKIPPRHRGILITTIRNIRSKIQSKDSDQIVTINIKTTVYRLIKSQITPR
jgi:hypothetical protein